MKEDKMIRIWVIFWSIVGSTFDFSQNGGYMLRFDSILDQLNHGWKSILVHPTLQIVTHLEYQIQSLSSLSDLIISWMCLPRQVIHPISP